MKHVLILVIFILGLFSSSLQGQTPESDFSFVVNNQSVDFTDLSTESPTTWFWDFGDGNTSTQQNVTHTFGSYGSFVTCFSVTNSFGSDSTCQTVSILPPVPIFSKAFDPPMISEGQSTTLIFTIDNSISNASSDNLSFVDNLPAGLQVSAVPNTSSTCIGGSLIAVPGSTSISYSGGDVGANSSCEIMVDVTPTVTGTFVNTTSDLTSDAGNSGSASATLQVNVAVPVMGEWGLIILLLLFFIFTAQYYYTKKIAKSSAI